MRRAERAPWIIASPPREMGLRRRGHDSPDHPSLPSKRILSMPGLAPEPAKFTFIQAAMVVSAALRTDLAIYVLSLLQETFAPAMLILTAPCASWLQRILAQLKHWPMLE